MLRADRSSIGVLPSVVCLIVVDCGHETSIMMRPWSTRDCCAMEECKYEFRLKYIIFRGS